MSFFDDLRNLDRNNVGAWPQGDQDFLLRVLVVVLILLAGWWFEDRDQQDELESLANKEDALRKRSSTSSRRAVNLPALTQAAGRHEGDAAPMLRQLPSKTEMPELLVDISQTALAAGIGVELFQPGPERSRRRFYAEKPIQLKMVGTYHQFGTFISGVASLPRVVILTMHDVSLQPVEECRAGTQVAPDGQLMLEGTVKTYRYVDDDEAAAAASRGCGRRSPVGGETVAARRRAEGVEHAFRSFDLRAARCSRSSSLARLRAAPCATWNSGLPRRKRRKGAPLPPIAGHQDVRNVRIQGSGFA